MSAASPRFKAPEFGMIALAGAPQGLYRSSRLERENASDGATRYVKGTSVLSVGRIARVPLHFHFCFRSLDPAAIATEGESVM
jgi:hypothetical protein